MTTIKYRQGVFGTYRYVEGVNLSAPMTREEMYTLGYLKPRYLAPAIREHYEFAWCLGRGVVLLHCTRGVSDA